MRVVFCTTVKNRLAHIRSTLPQNLADNPDSKFVVVGYNDQDGLADYIGACHGKDLKTGRLAFYEYRDPVPFRMAHAKNVAHRCGMLEGGEILVNLDADNYAGKDFDPYAQAAFANDARVFLWSRMVKDGQGRLPRGISGRIAVRSWSFVLAGGYDEKYETHSPDDKDFHSRLRSLGFDGREIDPSFLQAIRHNDKLRFREYPEARFNGVGEDYSIEQGSGVANGGRFGCARVWRNFDPDPIDIGPLPTRIFGIGMHKTGTTSLHHALQQLGYHSAHWQTAPWAKRLWREVLQNGQSHTLEQFYAICDIPMPLIWRQVDAAYPGSKFILTLRDEWKWLTSVRKHWSYEHNQFRHQWDSDVFSHRAHNLIYGRRDFDPTTMLERYRRHNAEVLEHFRGRPQDLLVMDLDKGHGWKELCVFLGVAEPSEPYPHKLQSK